MIFFDEDPIEMKIVAAYVLASLTWPNFIHRRTRQGSDRDEDSGAERCLAQVLMSRHYGLPSQAKLALAPGPDQTISRRQLLHHVRVYPLSPGDVSRRMCFGQDGIDYEDGGVWLPPGEVLECVMHTTH
jgi:hypothetical protein